MSIHALRRPTMTVELDAETEALLEALAQVPPEPPDWVISGGIVRRTRFRTLRTAGRITAAGTVIMDCAVVNSDDRWSFGRWNFARMLRRIADATG